MRGKQLLVIWVLAILAATLFLGSSITGLVVEESGSGSSGLPIYFRIIQVFTGLVVISSIIFLYKHKDDLLTS